MYHSLILYDYALLWLRVVDETCCDGVPTPDIMFIHMFSDNTFFSFYFVSSKLVT